MTAREWVSVTALIIAFLLVGLAETTYGAGL